MPTFVNFGRRRQEILSLHFRPHSDYQLTMLIRRGQVEDLLSMQVSLSSLSMLVQSTNFVLRTVFLILCLLPVIHCRFIYVGLQPDVPARELSDEILLLSHAVLAAASLRV